MRAHWNSCKRKTNRSIHTFATFSRWIIFEMQLESNCGFTIDSSSCTSVDVNLPMVLDDEKVNKTHCLQLIPGHYCSRVAFFHSFILFGAYRSHYMFRLVKFDCTAHKFDTGSECICWYYRYGTNGIRFLLTVCSHSKKSRQTMNAAKSVGQEKMGTF